MKPTLSIPPVAVGATAAAIAGLMAGAWLWPSHGRYQIAASGTRDAWRIDTVTGQASYCRTTGFEGVPICSAWGTQTMAEYRTAAATRRVPVQAPQPSAPAGGGMDPEDFRKLMEESASPPAAK